MFTYSSYLSLALVSFRDNVYHRTDHSWQSKQVILSFVITALLAIGMSSSLILQEFIECRRKEAHCKPHTIRRKLLSSYSDQQILQGIGLQSVGLALTARLSPYHFFLIWMLSLLSMAVHNTTLLALVHDFRRDWLLRWLRQFLMFVNLVLSSVYGAYILRRISHNIEPTLPIACVWDAESPLAKSSPENPIASYIGTGAVIVGNIVVFALATWYLHSRGQRFYKIVQVVGSVFMAAVGIGAIVRVILISQAFGDPGVPMADYGEKEWSFGQLLSVLLLILPVISILEIYRGELNVAPPVDDRSYLDLRKSSSGMEEGNEMQRSSK